MHTYPDSEKQISRAAATKCPHCGTRLGQAHLYADDWDEKERSGISGLRMSMVSIALILLLVGVLLIWQKLPSYYLWNYAAGVTIWLLAISIPVMALVALVSSILDLMRISGTGGGVAGKRSAVAGLILSFLVLTLCVFFFFSFKAPDSSQNAGVSQYRSLSDERQRFAAYSMCHSERRAEGTREESLKKGKSQRGIAATKTEKILDHELHELQPNYTNKTKSATTGLTGKKKGTQGEPYFLCRGTAGRAQKKDLTAEDAEKRLREK